MPEAADAAHWTEVEEATELLHEERYREAMVELRRVLQHDPKNPYAYYYLGIAFYYIIPFRRLSARFLPRLRR